MSDSLRTLELIAWDLDSYPFRPAAIDQSQARQTVAQRACYAPASPLCEGEADLMREALTLQRGRPDLRAEMQGLDWDLGVVDLRNMIAFQRRLTFNPSVPSIPLPAPGDWRSLLRVAFAAPHPITRELTQQAHSITLQSPNPNLHLRPTQNPASPLEVHAGSPFFEVALYRDRWFLRDGYHRAYALLQAGIFQLPAVVVKARSLEELGATKPRFFDEATLFSTHPPMLTDFLSPALTTTYNRPPTITTLRITWEETIAPAGEPT